MSAIATCCLILLALSVGTADAAESFLDPRSAEFASGTPGEAGRTFVLDLGEQRTNWNQAAWSVCNFEHPRDLSRLAGLRLRVSTDNPRRDAAVAVALREADGSWHYVRDAVDLVMPENDRLVRLADMKPAFWIAPHTLGMPQDHLDQNLHFDPEAVSAIAIGCANSLGIGTVRFTVERIEAVPLEPAPVAPITVTVTGRPLAINGTTTVPPGLFGHFPGGASRDMRVGSHREIHHSYLHGSGDALQVKEKYCEEPSYAVLLDVQGGDRYSPSGRLTDADWQRRYRRRGEHKGRQLVAYRQCYGPELIFEWWNEPYLNWSNRTRRNFDLDFFDRSRAREGGPVHLAVDGSVAPFLRWTRDYDAPPWHWKPRHEWRAGKDAKGRQVKRAHPPADVADGETFIHIVTEKRRDPDTGEERRVPVDEVPLTAYTPWYVYDVTQFTYWSGQSQLKFYNEPMLAFARGLHASCPDAKFVAGWDFRPSEDHWAGWNMLYKPTIDAGIEHLHGVTDHDYGGDVTRMPANYEVVCAYAQAYHDRRLYCYNTECGENSDPSANPAASRSMQQADKRRLKCMWAARKIVHALHTVPDKARSFTFHWFDQQAEGVAFNAMKNLRGRLIAARCTDPDVFVAAAVDGTDPTQPREPYLAPGAELVVAVFNDHRDERALHLPLSAPAGTRFTGLVVRRPTYVPDQGIMRLNSQEHAAAGASHTWNGTIAGKSLLVFSLPLDATPALDGPPVTRTQYVARDILATVTPDAPLQWRVDIPQEALATARSATIRCVFERLAHDEGQLALGSTTRDERGREQAVFQAQTVRLPACATPVNVCWIRDIPVEPDRLTPDTVLRFTAVDGHAGYTVCMASVMLER